MPDRTEDEEIADLRVRDETGAAESGGDGFTTFLSVLAFIASLAAAALAYLVFAAVS